MTVRAENEVFSLEEYQHFPNLGVEAKVSVNPLSKDLTRLFILKE
ncbi:MAG TPA: hypothetical protein VH186_14425 [Chloroflexia bacterium]|nr:hypothetical protein [Chloroflexia bacterium]